MFIRVVCELMHSLCQWPLKMNSSSARIGYARVSTTDQNLDAQIAALQAAGCTMIRTEGVRSQEPTRCVTTGK